MAAPDWKSGLGINDVQGGGGTRTLRHSQAPPRAAVPEAQTDERPATDREVVGATPSGNTNFEA